MITTKVRLSHAEKCCLLSLKLSDVQTRKAFDRYLLGDISLGVFGMYF